MAGKSLRRGRRQAPGHRRPAAPARDGAAVGSDHHRSHLPAAVLSPARSRWSAPATSARPGQTRSATPL